MKKIFGLLTLFSLFLNPPRSFSQEEEGEMIYYTDEDDDLFNRGKFVGGETDEYLRIQRKLRNRNWSIALGTTAVGIAALVLTANEHKKSK